MYNDSTYNERGDYDFDLTDRARTAKASNQSLYRVPVNAFCYGALYYKFNSISPVSRIKKGMAYILCWRFMPFCCPSIGFLLSMFSQTIATFPLVCMSSI